MNYLYSQNSAPRGLYRSEFEHDSCGVGFVAHIKGHRSHTIIEDAYTVLRNMEHRGACGAEEETGDGAGILTALPHEFLERISRDELKARLPRPGQFGAGVVFLPRRRDQRQICKRAVELIVAEQGQRLVGWRRVPTCAEVAGIGSTARMAEPHIEQLFIAAGPGLEEDAFERQLYLIRKRASHQLRGDPAMDQSQMFYICSLSTRVMIYKGMLRTLQLMDYYPDLSAPDYTTHLAMVHSRFSTNTFPSWDRAQPGRFMAHNGEINTLRGNINWMRGREGVMQSTLFGGQLDSVFPVIEPDCSDSGNFDNVLEFLLMSGRSLQEAIMMMVPEAWQKHATMAIDKKAFYEFHSSLMEAWDGPASITFTDGRYIGALLDRNGLRPSRYYVTHDDRVIMASEVGVLPLDPDNVKEKGRLQPGRMFLVDFEECRLVPDQELKAEFSKKRPYRRWLTAQRITLGDLDQANEVPGLQADTLLARMRAFGYTIETLHFMLLPLISQKRDPVGSMGNDSALACLSDQPRMLYDYFKQLFAQVTNPAIDSIREEVVMALECYVGPEHNLLDSTEQHCHRLLIEHPILTNREMSSIKHISHRGWCAETVDISFPATEGESGLMPALERICLETEQAIDDGCPLVVLTDREAGPGRVALSTLLASSTVHQHLVRQTKRSRVGLILETGEAREVHHHCLLIGFGADAVNPYLAYEALWQVRRDGGLDMEEFTDDETIVAAYRKGVAKGMLKVMGKMGISTLQSYKGAQIFEAVGLASEVIDYAFTHTASRVEGVGFGVLADELLRRHRLAYADPEMENESVLSNPGEFHWRSGGAKHGWEPRVIADIQQAARRQDSGAYHRFAEQVNDEASGHYTLRGLMELNPSADSISLVEVEPASEIVKRFCTGAMSLGSISSEAHETLAIAMNRLGGKSNTGEGGESSERFKLEPNGDSKRSAIKQVASGRFGVTAWYLTNADELQIKISQGAKPGEGGELPGNKVDDNIALIRCSTPGVGLISPPPHHDIYSIEDLAQLIYDLKNANPSARISVKLVSEVGVGTVAAGVAKAHADHILIAGDSGGTGASPLTSIKHAGLPWELGIAETHQTLVMNDLRSRVVLQTDGGMKTGRDVVIGALLGAEEIGFSTAPLVSLGCIMMRKCHLNTCPVGIATQDPILRQKFKGKPEHVVNYLFMVAEEARGYMAQLGIATFNELIGRVDLLDTRPAVDHWKANGIDLSALLEPVVGPADDTPVYCQIKQDHGLDGSLDRTKLLELCTPALEKGESVRLELPVANTDRTVGTLLSHELVKKWGEQGLPDNTIHVHLNGSAGQSLGAWLARGVTLELEGDANDYVGKGLSGGQIVVYPPVGSSFLAEDNIIVGNVVLYGATSGQAYFRGRAAERFCIRNSGALAVVEGVGDHGCEYMTGGRIVVLGPVGRNFAAGMSGGIAYVWAPDREKFVRNCNLEMVELERLSDDDMDDVSMLLRQHLDHTGSDVAQRLLDRGRQIFESEFIKVMPVDYKRVLEQIRQHAAEAVEDRQFGTVAATLG
ncbi:MAG: glutamate synthase large subunit [Arenicellales bacterium]|nr:glutamate synthase large subunit [Arenicellales bacterium]MDP7221234.1 glutamate synthase large subunit [Arenicellales bacterium]